MRHIHNNKRGETYAKIRKGRKKSKQNKEYKQKEE